VQRGGCEHRERRGIGILCQLALLARHAKARFDIRIKGVQSFRENTADFGILRCLGCRGADCKATARHATGREIQRQLPVVRAGSVTSRATCGAAHGCVQLIMRPA
jgi:hypothetical protein